MTLGEMVDEAIDGAAAHERAMAVSHLRMIARGLPEERLFPPNLTDMIADLILDLADSIENCEHFDETNEGETMR
jgi:hypothetical protein